jgi:sporulation protein YlmC with PRC-barrel domain
MSQATGILSASAVLGNKVKNSKGEYLGKVEELIIDPETGQIVGALLSREDLLPSEHHLAAIPWDALTLSRADGAIYVDPDIMRHPMRRKKDWPGTGEPPDWARNVVIYTSSIYKGSGNGE